MHATVYHPPVIPPEPRRPAAPDVAPWLAAVFRQNDAHPAPVPVSR